MRLFLFLFAIIITSCSSSSKVKPAYTQTDGYNLKYQIKTKTSGILFINTNQDSVPFNYSIIKTEKKVKNTDLKERSTTLFEYQITYDNASLVKYPILKQYSILETPKRKRIFLYSSYK